MIRCGSLSFAVLWKLLCSDAAQLGTLTGKQLFPWGLCTNLVASKELPQNNATLLERTQEIILRLSMCHCLWERKPSLLTFQLKLVLFPELDLHSIFHSRTQEDEGKSLIATPPASCNMTTVTLHRPVF